MERSSPLRFQDPGLLGHACDNSPSAFSTKFIDVARAPNAFPTIVAMFQVTLIQDHVFGRRELAKA
jgi:hypothetical protein